MKNRREKNRGLGDAGFTLIEVLLVVAILGILATIAVVGIGGHMEKANITASRGNIDVIGKAVELYRINFNKMPGSLEDLTQESEDIEAPLREVPVDSWGNPFQFKREGKFKYEIRSGGPDGNLNTEDDLTN
jgi:general secretion pathway protein G